VKAKTHPKPNLEQIAAILVDDRLYSVKHTCAVHNVSRTTLSRYRNRLKTDQVLGELVTRQLERLKPPEIAPTAQAVIREAYRWLRESIPKLHPSPENTLAVTAAVKSLRQMEMAETAMTSYIDALKQSNQRTTQAGDDHAPALPN
jgi:hypothetical protein